MKQLKTVLTNQESVLTKKKYFISLTSEEAHEKTHPTGAIARVAQKMHPVISKKNRKFSKRGDNRWTHYSESIEGVRQHYYE